MGDVYAHNCPVNSCCLCSFEDTEAKVFSCPYWKGCEEISADLLIVKCGFPIE